MTIRVAAVGVSHWHALNDARGKMTYRVCYCSVLDECWIGNFSGVLPLPDQLRPQRVKVCPMPKTPFLE